MGFYVLCNETSPEEILGLGSAGTVKEGTKKYAAPAKLLSYLNLLFFFFSFLPLLKPPLHMHYLILILMAERCLKSHRCTALATAVGLKN